MSYSIEQMPKQGVKAITNHQIGTKLFIMWNWKYYIIIQ